MLREAFSDFNRLRQIAVTAARYGFSDLFERAGVARRRVASTSEEPSVQRESTARRFRRLLAELGPTFIKMGQVLSTRADLLPAAYIEELAQLQDNVPPIGIEAIRAQIRRELGKEADELFQSIEPEPIAAASIAQVHRAITKGGEAVAVKVQRPGIEEQIDSDLAVLRSLARVFEATVEEMSLYAPVAIVDEFDRAIHEELDFLHEAENVKEFHAANAGRAFIKVPKVYEELSSARVLTLEFIEGVRLSSIQPGTHDPKQIARTLIEASFRQLFDDGLFHGDPHPGNIFILDGGAIALVDFGLVGRLTPQMRDTLILLALAIGLRDAESVARILHRIGNSTRQTDLIAFRADIEALLNRYLPARLSDISARHVLGEILDISLRYGFRLPREYAILGRASVAMEGVIRSLDPELNVGELALPYAKELLTARYDTAQLQTALFRVLLRVQTIASELPLQVSQLLSDAQLGKLTVRVRSDELTSMNANLRSIALIFFLGLCACAFIIGTFVSFATTPWLVRGVPVLGIVGAVSASFLFGMSVAWYFFGGSERKLSLVRLLKRRKRRAPRRSRGSR